MTIKDNFGIFNLFLDKKVKIFVDNKSFTMKVPTIKEFCLDEKFNAVYHIVNLPSDKMRKFTVIPCETSFELLNTIVFNLGQFKEYKDVLESFKYFLSLILPNIVINFENKNFTINNIIMTSEI